MEIKLTASECSDYESSVLVKARARLSRFSNPPLKTRRLGWLVSIITIAIGIGVEGQVWPDPDGDGYTEHRCETTVGYCPADTTVLACHRDGNRPQFRNGTPCLTKDGELAGLGDTCDCDHPDGCYSDCAIEPPCDEGEADTQQCRMPSVGVRTFNAATEYVFENEELELAFERRGNLNEILHVVIDVSETGDVLLPSERGRKMVAFDEGASLASHSIQLHNDRVDESHSAVRVRIVDEPGYRLALNSSTLVWVRDDDGQLIELSIDPLSRIVGEDGTAVFDLVGVMLDDTFKNVDDMSRVFDSAMFFVSWITSSNTAVASMDFHPVSETVLVRFDGFEMTDCCLELRSTLPGIAIIHDSDDESEESFHVSLQRSPSLVSRIVIDEEASTGTITVRDREDGDVRLRDGNVPYEGRLEVFYGEAWGTVCDDFWTDADARVACRQLGFPTAEPNGGRFLNGYFTAGNGRIWLDNVSCVGSEGRLIDCPRVQEGEEIGSHNCTHDEDVGIRCRTRPVAEASHGPLVGYEQHTGGTSDVLSLISSRLDIVKPDAIETFSRIRRLNLSESNVSDISDLSALTTLTWLDLSDNRVVDLQPLEQLTRLRYLKLSGNQIVDLSPLQSLTNLEVLFLDRNEVSDLGALGRLERLRYLVLTNNDVTDVRTLANLYALERVDLFGNNIANAGPLFDLPNLVWVRFPNCSNIAEAREFRSEKLHTVLIGDAPLVIGPE